MTYFWPTLRRASEGHGWNQSILVQFTSAGNCIAPGHTYGVVDRDTVRKATQGHRDTGTT